MKNNLNIFGKMIIAMCESFLGIGAKKKQKNKENKKI